MGSGTFTIAGKPVLDRDAQAALRKVFADKRFHNGDRDFTQAELLRILDHTGQKGVIDPIDRAKHDLQFDSFNALVKEFHTRFPKARGKINAAMWQCLRWDKPQVTARLKREVKQFVAKNFSLKQTTAWVRTKFTPELTLYAYKGPIVISGRAAKYLKPHERISPPQIYIYINFKVPGNSPYWVNLQVNADQFGNIKSISNTHASCLISPMQAAKILNNSCRKPVPNIVQAMRQAFKVPRGPVMCKRL